MHLSINLSTRNRSIHWEELYLHGRYSRLKPSTEITGVRFSKNCLEKCDSDWLSGWQFTALSKLVVLKNVHVKKIPTGLQIKMSKWNNGITRHVATAWTSFDWIFKLFYYIISMWSVKIFAILWLPYLGARNSQEFYLLVLGMYRQY